MNCGEINQDRDKGYSTEESDREDKPNVPATLVHGSLHHPSRRKARTTSLNGKPITLV